MKETIKTIDNKDITLTNPNKLVFVGGYTIDQKPVFPHPEIALNATLRNAQNDIKKKKNPFNEKEYGNNYPHTLFLHALCDGEVEIAQYIKRHAPSIDVNTISFTPDRTKFATPLEIMIKGLNGHKTLDSLFYLLSQGAETLDKNESVEKLINKAFEAKDRLVRFRILLASNIIRTQNHEFSPQEISNLLSMTTTNIIKVVEDSLHLTGELTKFKLSSTIDFTSDLPINQYKIDWGNIKGEASQLFQEEKWLNDKLRSFNIILSQWQETQIDHIINKVNTYGGKITPEVKQKIGKELMQLNDAPLDPEIEVVLKDLYLNNKIFSFSDELPIPEEYKESQVEHLIKTNINNLKQYPHLKHVKYQIENTDNATPKLKYF